MKLRSWLAVCWGCICSSVLWAAGFSVDQAVEVLWNGTWYKAKVTAVDGEKWKISYDGYSASWDEWVGPDRIRARGTPAASPAPASSPAVTTSPAPAAPAAETFPFPEMPPGKTAGLEGAYFRVVSWFWNGRVSLTNEGWFFTKNGRFSRTPLGGFDPETFATAAEARKTDGVYWLEDGKLVLRWAKGGKDESHEFARKPDHLEIGGLAATPVAGFPRGWRTDADYEGGATAVGSGSFVSSSNSLDLRADGTFGFAAAGSASISTSTGVHGASSGSESAGTYEFNGYTLALRHADGREEKRTVFAFGDRDALGAPEMLWREGAMLHRRN